MSPAVVQLVAILLVGAGDSQEKVGNTARPVQPGDTVTLRDGKSVRGIVQEWSPRSGLRMLVRREWVQKELATWADRWEKSASAEMSRARRIRRERLMAWRQQRTEADRVGRWIDDQLKSLEGPENPSTLMVISLTRGDVRTVKKGEAKATNAFRLAWNAEVPDPEKLDFADLKSAIESRGLLLDGTEVDLSALLPLRAETEGEWLMRRAATELQYDDGLRFLRYGSMVLAEPVPGAAVSPDVLAGALGETVRQLLDERPAVDPLVESFKTVEKRGRIAAMVTEIDLAHPRGVGATCTLWIRSSTGWSRAIWRSGQTNPTQLAAGAGDNLMNDPQVASIFRLLEASPLSGLDAGVKQKALLTGESARRALANARSGLQHDIERLDLVRTETRVPTRSRPPR